MGTFWDLAVMRQGGSKLSFCGSFLELALIIRLYSLGHSHSRDIESDTMGMAIKQWLLYAILKGLVGRREW